MLLSHEDQEGLTVLAIKGELVADETDRFRRAAIERMENKVRDFVLDLSRLEAIDSKGLETLLWLQEQATDRLGQVRLASCRDYFVKILEVTRLAGRLECCPDVASAVRSLRCA